MKTKLIPWIGLAVVVTMIFTALCEIYSPIAQAANEERGTITVGQATATNAIVTNIAIAARSGRVELRLQNYSVAAVWYTFGTTNGFSTNSSGLFLSPANDAAGRDQIIIEHMPAAVYLCSTGSVVGKVGYMELY